MAGKKLTRTRVIIAVTILTLLFCIVFTFLQYKNLGELREEIEEEKFALQLAEAELSRLINHRNNEAEYRERLGFVSGLIPPAAAEEELLRYLYYLSDLYDIKASDIRFDARTDGDGFTRLPISITMEGSYDSLQKLLDHFYSGDRVIRVDSLRIVRAGGADLRISILANAFYSASIQ